MQLEKITKEARWNEVINSFNYSDVFFEYSYLRCFKDEGGVGIPEAVYAKDGKNRVFYPYLRRPMNMRWIPKCYHDYSDITSAFGASGYLCEGNMSFFKKLWERFVEKERIVSEFIRFNPYFPTDLEPESLQHISDFVYIDYSKYKDIDSIFNSFSKMHRRNIKFAKKKYVVESISISDFMDSFELFSINCNLQRQYDSSIALECYTSFAPEKILCLGVKNITGKVLVSCVFTLKEGGICNYLFGAVNDRSRGLTPMILWEAIKISHSYGVKFFSFGGGISRGDNLFKFKEGFSNLVKPYKVLKKVWDSRVNDECISAFHENYENSGLFPEYRLFSE